MNGFLVSGMTISGDAYFEQLVAEFSERFTDDEIVKPKDLEEPELSPMFIHLKDARFFHNSGAPIPGNDPVLWRGRISEVSGFSLKEMTLTIR
jgi:hypothetical protein